MSTSRRVQNQPGWLLHHRPFRDSSRIIDILSRDHGRLSLVARGSRSAKSKLKGILRPFLPLQLSWIIRGDLGTLTGAEMNGTPITLSGDSLMSGYYLNELMLSLLHRHDPQPEIHAVYGAAIADLNGASDVAAILRRFEMETLGLLGYALTLDHEAVTGDALRPEQVYEYRVEQGPVAGGDPDRPMTFTGGELRAIARQEFTDATTLANAGRLLRHVIAWHLDGRELQSRKVLQEMRRVADQRTC